MVTLYPDNASPGITFLELHKFIVIGWVLGIPRLFEFF